MGTRTATILAEAVTGSTEGEGRIENSVQEPVERHCTAVVSRCPVDEQAGGCTVDRRSLSAGIRIADCEEVMVDLTHWCQTHEKLRKFEEGWICWECETARAVAEERESCAFRCDVLAEEAKNLSEIWLRKDEVRKSESFADKYYAFREAAKEIRGGN